MVSGLFEMAAPVNWELSVLLILGSVGLGLQSDNRARRFRTLDEESYSPHNYTNSLKD